MTKHPDDMDAMELKEWETKSYKRAKEYLFSTGQPLVYYQKDDTPVAENRDGKIELLN